MAAPGGGVGFSAPGKIILMGEHSVVYGHPAVVAALGLRLRARITPLAGTAPEVELVLPDIHASARSRVPWEELASYARSARERWQSYDAEPSPLAFARLRGSDPAHLVKVALGEALLYLEGRVAPTTEGAGGPPGAARTERREPRRAREARSSTARSGTRRAALHKPPAAGDLPLRTDLLSCRLEVASEIPVGSGAGSSAALAAAVLAAALACLGLEPDLDELEPLALEVERRQHGRPSGVDTAAVLHGGVVWAERGEGGLRIEPFPARGPHLGRHLDRFRVVHTGEPAESTGEVVAAVRQRLDREPERLQPVLERMGELTHSFRTELQEGDSPPRVMELVRRYQACLEELGVVPGPARELVRRVEAEGGAAKVSGAGALSSPPGGVGAGSLLIYHPEPEAIDGWGFLAGLRRLPAALGVAGLRRLSE